MRSTNSRVVVGVILIFIGLLLFSDSMDFFYFDIAHYIFSWPIILIFVGVIILLNSRNNSFGYILIAIGMLSFAGRFFAFHWGPMVRDFWPILLILFGLYLLYRKKENGHGQDSKYYDKNDYKYEYNYDGPGSNEHKSTSGEDSYHGHYTSYASDNSDFVDIIAVFSTAKRAVKSKNFIGGKITSIFGGVRLDLTDAKLAPGRQIIETLSIFGGTDMSIPADWKVAINVVSIFGGFDDKRYHIDNSPKDSENTLLIKGVSIFGGGKIRN